MRERELGEGEGVKGVRGCLGREKELGEGEGVRGERGS